MRVTTAALMAAALAVSTGCSTVKAPSFMPTFGKSKKTAADASKLTNAPPAPQLNGPAAQTAAAPAANASAWSNLPMYPGTSYPQTPHSTPTVAMGQPAGQGAMPHSTTPYTPYPTAVAQVPSYAPPAGPNYAAPQQGSYSPYAAPPATTPSYTQQTAPYTPPANPYAAPSQPQNAANPYGNLTR